MLQFLEQELERGDLPARAKIVHRLMGWCMLVLPRTTRAAYAHEQGW